MDFLRILWDHEEDPDGNVQHIGDHELTVEDVEHVLSHPATKESAGQPDCPSSGDTRPPTATSSSSTRKSTKRRFE